MLLASCAPGGGSNSMGCSFFRTEHDIAADRIEVVLAAIEEKDRD
jgi:mannitol-specific phosphotransferase system IIBC component